MLSGRHRNKQLSLLRACSIALLAIALAGAQIAGVAHRIAHAPGLGGPASWQTLLQEQDGGRTPAHDCAAYDAAILGDGPPLAQSAPASAPRVQHLHAAAFSAVFDSSPLLPFQSRAPPRA